jgi:gluconolactonase
MADQRLNLWDLSQGLPERSLMRIEEFAPFIEGLDHPEGVACGPAGEIYAGGEAGQIYRVEVDGRHRQIGSTGGFILGLCLDADANVYACDSAHHAVMRITQTGAVSTYANGTPERRMVTPNYPVFDAAGNLYVSDSGSWDGNDGCVFRVRPSGETEVLTEGVTRFPNGMALAPDGRHLYVVVSQVPAVVRLPITGDGAVGPAEPVIEMPRHVPDGLAFDEQHNLYISCYTPDVIYRLTPNGDLTMVACDFNGVTFATPTNIAFCGPDRRTLVVASLSRWHLTKGAMPIAGAKLHYPRLDARDRA